MSSRDRPENEAAARFAAAADALKQGDAARARVVCDELLSRPGAQAGTPAVLNLKALALASQGFLFAAAECIDQALALAPEDPQLLHHGARLHLQLGQRARARRHAVRALRAAPHRLDYCYHLAKVRLAGGDFAGARELAQRCVETMPAMEEPWILLHELELGAGRPDRAAAWLGRLIEREPENVRAWALLADLDSPGAQDESVSRALQRLYDRPDPPPERAAARAAERASLAFALGRRARRAGDGPRAAAFYREANELLARARPFDIEAWEAGVERILGTVPRTGSPATIPGESANRGAGAAGSQLVFVVGMPRSGTTLCEQMVSAHPRVLGGGELTSMEHIARAHRFDAVLSREDEAAWRERMRAHYLASLPPGSRAYLRVTDKAPRNFERIGLILDLFPAARVVWMLRHPLDTVLSCWLQDLPPGQGFSHRIDHAARFYLGQARLLKHALSAWPGALRVQHYEDLVNEPEASARQLAAFTGIEFDPAMSEPHRNPRHVRTASAAQVRRPVYTTSIGAWKEFAAELEPAREILCAAGLLNAGGSSRVREWLVA